MSPVRDRAVSPTEKVVDVVSGCATFFFMMEFSNFLIWNVRGLNNKPHRDAVRELVASTTPEIVCLQETKIQQLTTHTILTTLGSEFSDYVHLPAQGTRGGVLIAWKGAACQAITTRVDSFSTSVLFRNSDGTQWWFTGVYGPQPDDQKLMFLQEMRDIRAACLGPWLITGDFNLIYRAEDKNNTNVDRAMMGRFRRLLNDVELREIELLGRRYTWSNERTAPTLVRLDRAFCTADWENVFPDHMLHSTAAGISDHCPLLLNLRARNRGMRRFHFESFWPQLEGFYEVVHQAWTAAGTAGLPLQQLVEKFRATSRALQSWSQKRIGNVKEQLELARELLHRLSTAQESRSLTEDEDRLRQLLRHRSLALASLHRTIVRAKSRITWLAEGDANTNYFHSHARYRKRKNYIATLMVDDRTLTSHEEKEQAIWEFYNSLIGAQGQREFTLNLSAFHREGMDLAELDAPISEEEVWGVIKELAMDKAPGPDGFTGRFYKSCWQIIKEDIMRAIGALHGGDARRLQNLNSAYMVLIPKLQDAKQVGDFRPISLVHSFAKLVTKIMASRLSKKLNMLVAQNQSAYIKGRCIHDNFLLVQQMAKLLHKKRQPRVMFKLDITKAFDTVSWPFMLEVLTHLGFGRRWRTLICNLLYTSSTRILLNGEPGEPIHHRRGLRQGDPLSPMMFIIIMDVLTSLVREAENRGLLHPLAAGVGQHRLSLYADDVVLFTSTDSNELNVVKNILRCFGVASGLNTNMAKSFGIPIWCDDNQILAINDAMPCELRSFPCKYLGLPLSIWRLGKTELQPILDKVADALPGWKAALLAKSGRLVLVKAVLTAIPLHVLIAINVPKWFLKAVDKFRRGFLWKGRADVQGGHCPISWERVTRPLQFGGLGIQSLERLGWALRMRWLWLHKTEPDRPWAFAEFQVPQSVHMLFVISVVTTVGDGKNTKFWTDRWLHGQCIQELAPALMPYVRRRGWKSLSVADGLRDNSWTKYIIGGLPVLASWQYLQLREIVTQQQLLPDTPDAHQWLPSSTGIFSTKSAYLCFFNGSVRFEPYKRLWKSWAPLKAKIFAWMALLNRCWTAERLTKRGLPNNGTCPLCDQHPEEINHLLLTCPHTREIWFQCLRRYGLQYITPSPNENSLAQWWRNAARRLRREQKKGLNTLVILVSWEVWKYRNRCIFDGERPHQQRLLQAIREEGERWIVAGATKLRQLSL